MMGKWIATLAGALSVAAIGGPASAESPLPPATFSLSLDVLGVYQETFTTPTSKTISYNSADGSGTAIGTMTSNVNGKQSIGGSSETSQDLGVQSDITIDYYFRGDGPAGGTVVFDWAASGATSINGGASATALLYKDGTLVALACQSSTAGDCGTGSSFGFSTKFSAPANATQVIEIDLYGNTAPYGGGPFSASIDPLITIDPSSAAQGYSLELSPNITQGSAAPSTPEASTWAMMLAGFAGLGFAYRARRRAPVADKALSK
jgi:hypothetical protein